MYISKAMYVLQHVCVVITYFVQQCIDHPVAKLLVVS